MGAEKSPAFQFYPKDYLSSSKVQRMSLTEQGIYITLLAHAWLDHGLPDDIEALARTVRLNPSRFSKMWSKGPLKECFTLVNGRLVNPRQERQREALNEFKSQQRAKAEARWHSRGNAVALPKSALPRECSSSSSSSAKRERGTPPDTLLSLWNETVKSLPKAQALSADRRRHAKQRLSEHSDLAWWTDVFVRMEASDFLTGRKPSKDHPDWRADIDFALRPGVAEKVLEGKYDNRTPALAKSERSPVPDVEATRRLLEKYNWERPA